MKAKCYDPSFRYRKACETSVRLTIAREKRRLAAIGKADIAEPSAKVLPLKKPAK